MRPADAPGEAGGLAGAARALRQPRRVEGRSGHPPGPGSQSPADAELEQAGERGGATLKAAARPPPISSKIITHIGVTRREPSSFQQARARSPGPRPAPPRWKAPSRAGRRGRAQSLVLASTG